MKLQLIFENGAARVVAVAEDNFERRMLGVLAGERGGECTAQVRLSARYSHSPDLVDHATIVLEPPREGPSQP